MTAQQEDEFHLRKASEFLAHCREAETQARIALAQAMERTKRAKEKHETLFTDVQNRTVARMKAGDIPCATAGY